MTLTSNEIAARLFVCMPGMLYMKAGKPQVWLRCTDTSPVEIAAFDTQDPATQGCMLSQVDRKAYTPVHVWYDVVYNQFKVSFPCSPEPAFTGDNRGEALTKAMSHLVKNAD